MFDVACLGIMVADIIIKPVDSLPKKGMSQLVDRVLFVSGGGAMSASINIKKLGLDTAFIGKVGDDMFGKTLLGMLGEKGVNIKGISIESDNSVGTSTSVITIDSNGERTYFHNKGTNDTFSINDVDWSVIDQSDIVFVSGIMLMGRFEGKECAEFLAKCKEKGKITVLDTAWSNNGKWYETLKDSVKYLDYFLPSYDEAREITGKQTPEDIGDFIMDMGAGTAVVKLGSKGCYVKESRDTKGYYIDAFKDINVVDTTGAGDAFCSGFLYGISTAMSIRDSVVLANATGAHCAMSVGATEGMKTYDEIKKFIQDKQVK